MNDNAEKLLNYPPQQFLMESDSRFAELSALRSDLIRLQKDFRRMAELRPNKLDSLRRQHLAAETEIDGKIKAMGIFSLSAG